MRPAGGQGDRHRLKGRDRENTDKSQIKQKGQAHENGQYRDHKADCGRHFHHHGDTAHQYPHFLPHTRKEPDRADDGTV